MSQKGISGKVDVGVRLNLHSTDASGHIHVQRSDDGTTSTIEREWRVPATQEQVHDPLPPTKGVKHYRVRGIGRTGCVNASSWTAWRQARGGINVGSPDLPKTPVAAEILRDPSIDTLRMDRIADFGGQAVITATTAGYELYSYDSSTAAGGVKVGARKAGTTGVGANATDFDLRKGGETITVPGSEFSANENTKYHVFYARGAAGVDGTQTKSTALDWDRISLGAKTATLDGSTSIGSTGGINPA